MLIIFLFQQCTSELAAERPVTQLDDGHKEDFEREDKREEGAETDQSRTKNRNQKKKKKKKRARKAFSSSNDESEQKEDETDETPAVEIEYVQEEIVYDEKNPFYKQFAKIFDVFRIRDEKTIKKEEEEEARRKELQRMLELKKVPKFNDEEEEEEKKEKTEEDKPKISKRKQKQLSRMSVAELKQCVARPDVVEMHDVTARDPKLLVLLKATRNTVPVPRHWCAKRKYLQVNIENSHR